MKKLIFSLPMASIILGGVYVKQLSTISKDTGFKFTVVVWYKIFVCRASLPVLIDPTAMRYGLIITTRNCYTFTFDIRKPF